MTVLATILSFLMVLVPLIIIHEAGHYLAARHVGVRVEQFSIGFPPRMVGRQWGETEYLISWIPLGGYVRLFGQNLDDEDPRDPRNYAAKSLLQRFYILVAGPAANLVTALVVMPLVFLIGVETPAHRLQPPVVATIAAGSPAESAGILPGDRVTRLDDEPTPTWETLYRRLEQRAVGGGALTLALEREGREVVVNMPAAAFTGEQPFGWAPLIQPVAGFVAPGSPAEQAGLRSGDRIVSIEGVAITRWDQISPEVRKGGGKPLRFALEREGSPLVLEIAPRFDKEAQNWLIGISPQTVVERFGPIESFVRGTRRLGEITAGTFIFIGSLFTGKGSLDQVGGPVKIATFIERAAGSGIANLAMMVAFISLQLGLLNLLPIPALDGGHAFYFLGSEWVKGGPLSPRLRAHIQTVGITLLMLLMIIVTYNDILQLL